MKNLIFIVTVLLLISCKKGNNPEPDAYKRLSIIPYDSIKIGPNGPSEIDGWVSIYRDEQHFKNFLINYETNKPLYNDAMPMKYGSNHIELPAGKYYIVAIGNGGQDGAMYKDIFMYYVYDGKPGNTILNLYFKQNPSWVDPNKPK